jgi:hypothetical protein
MSLRIVGWASVVLGIGVVLLALNHIGFTQGLAAALTSDGHAWSLPVSQEVFLTRSKIWSGVVMGVGILTGIGGFRMALRRRWGFHVVAFASVVMVALPLMTRILLPQGIERRRKGIM